MEEQDNKDFMEKDLITQVAKEEMEATANLTHLQVQQDFLLEEAEELVEEKEVLVVEVTDKAQ